MKGPADVVDLIRDSLRHEQKEHFIGLYLNARHAIVHRETISVGCLDASLVHPREVYRPALLHAARSIVLIHNHPSGDPTPSEEDLAITKRLKEAGRMIGVDLIDHIIIAGLNWVSMCEKGIHQP